MSITNNAKFMHCLPIRRNLVATDNVIDSEQSLIIDQSENRIYTAQHIIKKLLKMDKILIVKIGGKLINNSHVLHRFLKSFAKIKTKKILIHGGGNQVTKMCKKLNLDVKIRNGRRITSIQDLEVATMIYAGSLNKTLVTKLQSFNCNSIGLSGADANLIESVKRPVKEIDYGLVGDIKNKFYFFKKIDRSKSYSCYMFNYS